MAIRRKSSREIEVDGIEYRWVVSPDSGYAVVVVERFDEPGARLLGYCHPYKVEAGEGHRAITPQAVANLIRAALNLGWRKSKTEFSLRDADRILWPDSERSDS